MGKFFGFPLNLIILQYSLIFLDWYFISPPIISLFFLINLNASMMWRLLYTPNISVIKKHLSIWSFGTYMLLLVPDLASIDSNVDSLLLTATISGSHVLEPPNLLALHSPMFNLLTRLCSKLYPLLLRMLVNRNIFVILSFNKFFF